MKNYKKIISFLVITSIIISLFTACNTKKEDAESASNSGTIRIGHKNFTEQRILGQMFAALIEEKTGRKTDVKEFGGTNIAFEALKSGEIDIYPDYTGTAYGAILGLNELNNPDEIYDYVVKVYKDEFNVIWGSQLGFNNTYTFAVLPEIAEKYNLKTISDLKKVAPELKFISTTEFLERSDGLPGVKEAYGGFEFAKELSMDPGIRYAAISEKQGDLMDAFSTDGKLLEYNLVVLEDDKGFFPPYYVAPLFNGDFYENNSDVYDALEQLKDIISDEDMMKMNYEVDTNGINEREVAEDYLKEKGLID